MKKFCTVFNILYVALAVFGVLLKAQSLPVGTPVLDDYYRRMQLLQKSDSTLSFSVRPIFPAYKSGVEDVFDPEQTLKSNHWVSASAITFGNGHGVFKILPLTIQQQFNSSRPYGWNDGAMIPAKGYQVMASGGFYFKYGPLSIQFRPEILSAANNKFNGFAEGHGDQDLQSYYGYHNLIDAPERFGTGAYNKAYWGQSSIRLTFGAISAGLSNENLWWGPGIRNALILSNNAPGFKHFTLNTVHPVQTIIGAIEGQIIAGRLDGSGYAPLATTTLSNGANLFAPKSGDWRYFTGLNVNYHPKWITGLVLGFTRTFDAYKKDVNSFNGYFPYFTPFQKKDVGLNGDPFPRDQYTSVYTRWLFTQAQAEIYFEYGLNDNLYNYNDLIGSPDHSRAYIFGLRKMVKLNNHQDQYILFSTEITQLSQTTDRLVRDAQGWYMHSTVRDGQTNLGQVLGAGTGSGGNLQSLDLSWVKGLKKLGIQFERYEHDVDFSTSAFPPINGNSRKWVDLALALAAEWDYKNLIFNVKVQSIKSLNYEWVLKDYNPDDYYIPHNDVSNLHAELGLTFRF